MGQAASRDFTTTLGAWVVRKMRQFDRNLFESYRPELHYMRGPGPKWREKHGPLPASNDLLELGLNGFGKAGA